MTRFRLANVLRARQVQEDLARGALLRARSEADDADDDAVHREQLLTAGHAPTAASAGAFVSALYARQSLAAELSAATALATLKREAVTERLNEYTDASIRRRGVEKLGEKHAAVARAAEEAAAQRELDDLATTAKRPSRD